jgi:hypothetical protein
MNSNQLFKIGVWLLAAGVALLLVGWLVYDSGFSAAPQNLALEWTKAVGTVLTGAGAIIGGVAKIWELRRNARRPGAAS